MLDRVTEEMTEDLIKMKQATAKVMASERQMAAKYSQAQTTADDWLRRAELAVNKGQDDLAREALVRRKAAEGAATALKTQVEAQRRALDQLTANTRMLEGKVAEARNKVRGARLKAGGGGNHLFDSRGGCACLLPCAGRECWLALASALRQRCLD